MASYLNWSEKTITDFSPENISKTYSDGFVFTRLGKGKTQQTRSVRVNLEKFTMSSENRRIIKKVEGLELASTPLPLKDYDFKLGKLAKDFYEKKFGVGVMSAQKIKEMITDAEKSNFNTLFVYKKDTVPLGYAICYANNKIVHYSYPFYDLEDAPKDMGLAMMTLAIRHAKEADMRYIYLGSLQRPSDPPKLQFEGLEWFDGKAWQTDIDEVKKILASAKM